MGVAVNYHFEWDPRKAAQSLRKHGIVFAQAATVFRDPRALSIYDVEHSSGEDRWLTVGISAAGGLLVVHHTFEEIDASNVRIRIISSRKATKAEVGEYRE
jgi:uncharacterized DUF497 family protein